MIKKCLHGVIVLLLLLLGSQCAKEELTPEISEPVSEEFSLENIEDETIRNFLDFSYVSALNPQLIQSVDSRDDEALITNTNAKLWLKEVDGVIYFSKGIRESGSQLRTILKTPTGFQAHHVIPWSFRRNPLVQKASRSGKFHMNDHLNGINLDLSIHNGYNTAHAAYNELVRNRMDNLYKSNQSPDEAFDLLNSTITSIRTQLESGKKLDEITLP